MNTDVRLVTPADAASISALIIASFQKLAAADWEDSAQQKFIASSSADSMAEALQSPAYAAAEFWNEFPIGFILFPEPSLLGMLFVHPDRIGQGVARRLWEAGRAHIESVHPDV